MSITVSTLWITLIGMGLVFIGILALWGLMELIVKVTNWYAIKHPEFEEGEEEAIEAAPALETLPAPTANKQQAAAAAVAVALALKGETEVAAPIFQQLQDGHASAWQAVMRSTQLSQRSSQFNRKSRGNVR
jgi:Na+-transporting methylmalonyl-CoA/oxaloacetate decarboxylase gamma subunit